MQKDVGPFRKTPSCCVGEHLVPHVEGMLRALCELLRYQLPTGGEPAVLSFEVNIGRISEPLFPRPAATSLCISRNRWRCHRHLFAAFLDERSNVAFQILLLFLDKCEILHSSPVEYGHIDIGAILVPGDGSIVSVEISSPGG
jgi:hypothetical protein